MLAVKEHDDELEARRTLKRAQRAAEVMGLDFPSLASIGSADIPPTIPIVENLLYPGAWLVVGRPKIGKSWLLLQLALAVAEKGSFLGYQCHEDAEVLAVFGEDNDARIHKRLALLGVVHAPANVHVINQDGLRKLAKAYGSEYSFTEFLNVWLQQHRRVRLVVIDTETTVRQVWGGERQPDANARIVETDYQQTRAYDVLGLRWQLAILLVNHASKRKGEWTDIHELINRSNTALAGASGSVVLADPPDADPLDTKSKQRILGVRGRDLDDDITLAVRQQKAPPVFLSEGPYIETRQTDAETEMLEGLELLTAEAGDKYVTLRAIAEEVGKSTAAVHRTCSRMLKKGTTRWKKFRIEVKRGTGGGIRLVST